jgi:hypothetical protein
MTENGNASHDRDSRRESFEMTNVSPATDPDHINAYDQDHSRQMEDSDNSRKISDNEDPLIIERHGVEVELSIGESDDEVDAASINSSIPTVDDRPEVATFRRRQAQMLPICIKINVDTMLIFAK